MKIINYINTLNKNINPNYLNKNLSNPYNKDNYDILKVLESEGFLSNVRILKLKNKIIEFNFNKSLINPFKIIQISKSGRKVYISNKEINTLNGKKNILNNSKIAIKSSFSNDIYIIRTSKGIMSASEAVKLNIGGELLLKIKH